ncbi:MAG: hypothetical protein QG641_39 [Candidatus Poribacteria bacterium]|nr:hypothetical protein [Candidatus Poribacteria bacterium]MDQ1326759.1 hypothetical protein [Candidatus Poribacteria bacterium]
MSNQSRLKDLETEEYLDNIESALIQLKKKAIYEKKVDLVKNQKAWDNLMSLSEEITKKWKGDSAVDEIRSQRTK